MVQNFMSADFSVPTLPCVNKVAGADVGFDGFGFSVTTVDPDGAGPIDVALTEEHITVDGLAGDLVSATDVYVIENNCAVDVEVSLTDGAQTGAWAQKRLEVWLGQTDAATDYPDAASADWVATPLVFDEGGPSSASSGSFTVAAGGAVSVGMVVYSGQTSPGVGSATWTVQAVYTP